MITACAQTLLPVQYNYILIILKLFIHFWGGAIVIEKNSEFENSAPYLYIIQEIFIAIFIH